MFTRYEIATFGQWLQSAAHQSHGLHADERPPSGSGGSHVAGNAAPRIARPSRKSDAQGRCPERWHVGGQYGRLGQIGNLGELPCSLRGHCQAFGAIARGANGRAPAGDGCGWCGRRSGWKCDGGRAQAQGSQLQEL